jgi:hypothetical protein
MEVEGSLVSLNKESNRGSFRLRDGKNVRYHFVGDNKEKFYRDFGHKGLVKIVGNVTFDSSLSVTHIDIVSVIHFQPELPFTESGN